MANPETDGESSPSYHSSGSIRSRSPISTPSGNSSRTTTLSDTPIREDVWSPYSDSETDSRFVRERSRSPRRRIKSSASNTGASGAESSQKSAYEPPYYWAGTTAGRCSPFEAEPRDFIPGKLDIPDDFVDIFKPESQSEIRKWIEKLRNLHGEYRDRHEELVERIQELESGMRRLESKRGDWIKHELDKIAPMPKALYRYCRGKRGDK